MASRDSTTRISSPAAGLEGGASGIADPAEEPRLIGRDMALADADPSDGPPLPPRKQRIRALCDRLAPERAGWIERNRYFHEQDRRYMRFLVPAGSRVLELGCGIGD